MTGFNRRTAPKVKRGYVQKKNNWTETADYYNSPQQLPVVDRKRPGYSYRHLLTRHHIYDFIDILPDWQELSRGLNAIVLAPGSNRVDGYYSPGVVHICAWDSPCEARQWTVEGYAEHKHFLERLGVPVVHCRGFAELKWTESSARAYQLLHILPHELGHHHDAFTTKPGGSPNRGENYAETYALKYADLIWDRYLATFGQP